MLRSMLAILAAGHTFEWMQLFEQFLWVATSSGLKYV
jgi:hypothetical protein